MIRIEIRNGKDKRKHEYADSIKKAVRISISFLSDVEKTLVKEENQLKKFVKPKIKGKFKQLIVIVSHETNLNKMKNVYSIGKNEISDIQLCEDKKIQLMFEQVPA